jgi:hypothetical protein
VKSGAISRIRQERDSCTAFGSLMAVPSSPFHTASYG